MPNEEADTENSEEEKRAQRALQKRLRELQLEEQKKLLVRKILDPAAYERLMNIRAANPDLYRQLLDLLLAMLQGNRLHGRISEEDFKKLLLQLTSRPESSIQIRHK